MYYEEWNRGKIQNEERAKQIIDFSGTRFGNITPTDLDGLIEYEHCVDDPHENIIAADASVRRYYFRGRWYPAVDREFTGRNVLQTIKNFIELAERMNKLF